MRNYFKEQSQANKKTILSHKFIKPEERLKIRKKMQEFEDRSALWQRRRPKLHPFRSAQPQLQWIQLQLYDALNNTRDEYNCKGLVGLHKFLERQ